MHKLALTLAAIGLATGAAYAQTAMSFVDVDTDANGELSLAELQVAWPDFGQTEFTTADADTSGGLSAAEVTTLQAAAPAPASAPAPAAPLSGTPAPQL